MKLINKIIVGSIILLVISAPLIATAKMNKNIETETINATEINLLGQFNITHVPLFWQYFKHQGMIVENYIPPQDNPGYIYYFPEDENGTVWMNFSLIVDHWLNDVGVYWSRFRYTWLNNLYVYDDTTDYVSFDNKHRCGPEKSVHETYTIQATSVNPLKTNGENKTVFFGPFGCPAITPIPLIHNLTLELFLRLPRPVNFLKNWLQETKNVEKIELTIIPI